MSTENMSLVPTVAVGHSDSLVRILIKRKTIFGDATLGKTESASSSVEPKQFKSLHVAFMSSAYIRKVSEMGLQHYSSKYSGRISLSI